MSNKQLTKKVLTGLCYLTLLHGIYWVYLMFFGMTNLIDGAIGMAVGQTTGFLIFIYIATTMLLLKLKDKEKNPRAYRAIGIIGFTISGLFALPLMFTPLAINIAEDEFAVAFGADWESKIDDSIKQNYFLQNQFSLAQYFLGTPNKDCKIDPDVLFYSGEGITLYCDVYRPRVYDPNMPGKNSTIIKIHGGGWTVGDKGIGNMIAVNKYLASQGYIVFDIQYGLRNLINFQNSIKYTLPDTLISKSHRSGDFTVEDQIRHIGIFTKVLVNNYTTRFFADNKSVYIMGGSAGGHLTSVFGLGYNDPYFAGIYGNITIKGIIPIYPANDARIYFDKYMPDLLDGTPSSNPTLFDKYTPSKLTDANDPPALIFQGTSDGLATMDQSGAIQLAMQNSSLKCIRMLFPLAGHMNDFLFNSNYGQVWLYYLERFLYLTQ